MYRIQTLNKISTQGLDRLPRDIYETASSIIDPDGIILRSYKMHDMDLPASVKAVARAGAGVNNIPVDDYTDKGVVVFNTPGANANSVKELVITSLLMSSRKIYDSLVWSKSLIGEGDEVPKLVEKGKSNFAGPEIKGKTLGVIGLGAIGVMVANAASALGMNVVGYDPYISVDAAWGLSRKIVKADNLEKVFAEADYLTMHVPLNDKTKGLINEDKFALMKKGVRILNFSRGGLVNNKDLFKAIEDGIVSYYVTDFPDEELLKNDAVIPLPHLGASTPEAEENCAVMAVDQIRDFLENGNIVNSVNFPACSMDRSPDATARLIIANKNVPNMVGQITSVLAGESVNISGMVNTHRNDIAYNIIDTDTEFSDTVVEKIKAIDGVVMVRVL